MHTFSSSFEKRAFFGLTLSKNKKGTTNLHKTPEPAAELCLE